MDSVITANNTRVSGAFNSRDFATVEKCYAEDCRLMAPGSPTVIGNKNVTEFWKAAVSDNMHSVQLKTTEIFGPMQQGTEQTAIERGIVTFSNKDGNPSSVAKYVVVWKKVGDDWKMFIDIFNSDDK